ncbi:MAG: hypothetical protein FWE69_01790 [Clostridiales bacterium]|nr:hypothetical protein [Clostridiales bacterium]
MMKSKPRKLMSFLLAAAILRHLVQLKLLTPQGEINAKMTSGTSPVSAACAAKVLRWLVQLELNL